MTHDSGTPWGSEDSVAGESAPETGPATDIGAPAAASSPVTRPRSDRSWLAPLATIAGLFLVLMLAATASVIVFAPSKPPAGASRAGSPSAAVQAWALAMEAGDSTTADQYLSSRLRSQGTTSDDILFGQKVTALSVVSESIQGDSATVQVTLVTSSFLGDSSGGLTTASSVPMVLENGGWKIDNAIFDSSI